MFSWPWSKHWKIVCPDGSTRIVAKHVDHAFPLYLQHEKVSIKSSIDALKKVKGTVQYEHQDKIDYILVQIDELNRSMQAHFRAAYINYQAAPCKNLNYLQLAIDDIRKNEQENRWADFAVKTLVHLISQLSEKDSNDSALVSKQIGDHINKIVIELTRNRYSRILIETLENAERDVQDWSRQ